MIYKASKAIEEDFRKSGIKFRVEEDENSSRVVAGFTPKNGSPLRAQFISNDDDNDVSIRLFTLVHATDDTRDAILKVVNECNQKYRYCKFVLDDDNDVNVEYDFLLRSGNVGPMATEYFIRLMKIVEDVYPLFMKALWA
ncbi:MAG: YbjN domain-containing protein [Oscillospiraceae bacterium]|nr:YbjN domain-containing protein [Oscillospiraceae bacterium]